MIRLFKVRMADDAAERVAKVLASGYIGQGPVVDEFEERLKVAFDSPVDVLTVNSGTSALDLCLHVAGVRRGDVVCTSAMTCSATTSAIVNRGAIPAWADVAPATGLIDPESVKQVIYQAARRTMLGQDWRVAAIMAIDWGGAPCDYERLRSFGLAVIEDAAHAHLATIGGRSIARAGGTHVAWSFQAIKHLGTPDGGAIVVPAEQVERARLLRWFGLDRRSSADFRCAQRIQESGYKYQWSDPMAAIGLANLAGLRDAVAAHRANAEFYHSALAGLPGVELPAPNAESSWWLYTIRVDRRDEFIAFAKERGVECSPVHSRNDLHPCFQRVALQLVPLKGLDEFASREAAIPVGWWLTVEERARVAEVVAEWANR